MGEGLKAFFTWVYKAPLPAVIGLLLALSGWVVYTQDALHAEQVEQAAEIKTMKDKDVDLKAAVDKIDEKLDKLLEAVLESRATQKATQERLDRAQARRDAQAQKDAQAKEGQKP
jgi:hypothetical protein